MTNEKAIEILGYNKSYMSSYGEDCQDLIQALEMAIEALKDQEHTQEYIRHLHSRLEHLYKSKFIGSFDRRDEQGIYLRDIKEADKIAKEGLKNLTEYAINIGTVSEDTEVREDYNYSNTLGKYLKDGTSAK